MSMSAVEWKKLGDVANYYRGVTYNKKQEVELNTGGTKILRANNISLETNRLNFDDIKEISQDVSIKDYQWLDVDDILICAGSGSKEHVGKVAFIEDKIGYAYGGFMGKIVVIAGLLPRYLYHIISGSLFKNYLDVSLNSTTINNLNSEIVNNFLIPIPSLAKQQEIVSHLDTFTTLISNLESELDMRRKQYEHYRNQLLDFEGVEGVEWKKLGEVGLFYGGLSGKSKEDFQDGNAKFVTYMNIYSNSSLDTTIVDMVKVGENEKQNSINYGDILFTGSSETPDDCGMSCVVTNHVDEPIYLNSFCFGFRFNEVEKFEPSFFKHYFRCTAMRKAIAMTASGVTRFNVSKKRLAKVQMPILSINEQREIGKLLDTFTTLISNLEQEIKLRKQQYEYYREKLLTFE